MPTSNHGNQVPATPADQNPRRMQIRTSLGFGRAAPIAIDTLGATACRKELKMKFIEMPAVIESKDGEWFLAKTITKATDNSSPWRLRCAGEVDKLINLNVLEKDGTADNVSQIIL